MDEIESEDAKAEFLRSARNADSFADSTRIYFGFLRAGLDEVSKRRAPFTKLLIFTTLAVFSVQVGLYLRANEDLLLAILTLLTERGSLEGLNAWIFINHPLIAWPLAEFIHRGIGHFLVNVGLLALFGGFVEPRFRRRYFVLWFLVVALTATPSHVMKQLMITTKPHVAVYGISDFVAALGLFSMFWVHRKSARSELDYIAFILGGVIVLQTIIELVYAVSSWSLLPINVGHLVGGLVGVLMYVAYRRWESELSA